MSPRLIVRFIVSLVTGLAMLWTGCSRPESVVIVDLLEEARLQFVAGPGVARLNPETGLILLEPGMSLELYLEVPKQASLVVDRVASEPERPILVEFQRDESSPAIFKMERVRDGFRVSLPDEGNLLSRITFSAPAAERDDAKFGVWRPRIEVSIGSDAPLSSSSTSTPAGLRPFSTTADHRPNVIVYLVDTLRKDRLGSYGYQRPVTPKFDEFATVATVYDRAYGQSSWTRPSVASIFTGLGPSAHGVNDREDALPDEALTLAEVLKESGYETAAFITNGNVGSEFNFDQGFETFSAPEKRRYLSDQLNVRLSRFLAQRDSPKPLFLYVHSIDPHAPYRPEEPYRSEFAADVRDVGVGEIEFLRPYRNGRRHPSDQLRRDVEDLYDAEVANNDRYFGEFLRILEEKGLYDNSWIVLTSDHGEEFWDHGGWGHGHSLYGELIDIPFLVRAPQQHVSRRSSLVVQHMDLFATALDYAGDERPREIAGVSLRRESSLQVPRSILSVIRLDRYQGSSVIHGEWKLIVPESTQMGPDILLFNVVEDPLETTNLYSIRPVRAGYLTMILRRESAMSQPEFERVGGEITEDLRKRLQALGYLE